MNPVERSKDITKDIDSIDSSIRKFAIMDSLPTAMLGLGLYGKFAPPDTVFHPFLSDSSNVNTLIVLGAVGMAICGIKIVTLVIAKARARHSI